MNLVWLIRIRNHKYSCPCIIQSNQGGGGSNRQQMKD